MRIGYKKQVDTIRNKKTKGRSRVFNIMHGNDDIDKQIFYRFILIIKRHCRLFTEQDCE